MQPSRFFELCAPSCVSPARPLPVRWGQTSLDSALTMRIGSKLADSTLNMTEVLWLGPENRQVYLGSPSITKAPSGRLLV